MIQNIKVDTIYYLTNSDFEMEFNLCGCCKMRLLTDKADNPKGLVNLLARAVSRSQVIICCGKLFDKDGIINIVSHAVKKPLKKINNGDYGIADNSEIEIMEGSVPLVNGDGCFCGCIAESGPQSIIMITDNKSIRKTVMKSLIHPYIEELSLLAHKAQTVGASSSQAEETEREAPEEPQSETSLPDISAVPVSAPDVPPAAAPETPLSTPNTDILSTDTSAVGDDKESVADTCSESANSEPDTKTEKALNPEITDEVADQSIAETESENKSESKTESEANAEETATEKEAAENILSEVIIDGSDGSNDGTPDYIDPAEINSGFGLYLEPERVKYSKKNHYSVNYIPSKLDSSFISESDDGYFEDEVPNVKFLNYPILIVVIILLLAIAALCYLLIFVPMRSDYVFSEFIRHIFSVAVNGKII